MNTEQLGTPALLDILFEHRNKQYGAYDLRKFYNHRLAKALLGMLLLSGMLFTAIGFSAKKVNVPVPPDVRIISMAAPPAPVEPPVPNKPPEKPIVKAASRAYVQNIKITREEATGEALVKDLDKVAIASVTQVGPAASVPIVQAPLSPGISAGQEPAAVPINDPSVPRFSADVMPAYPGGMEALRKFLQQHLQTPDEVAKDETVLVKVKFVVGYDGKLQAFEIVQDGGAACNREVMRVLRKMPDWIPGKSNGQRVSVYYTIPVRFMVAD